MKLDSYNEWLTFIERLVKLIAPYLQKTVGSAFILAMCYVKLFYPERLSTETMFTVLTLLYSVGFVQRIFKKGENEE